MADEFAQLNEATPFQPVTPNDKSAGYDALSEAFGKIAKGAETQVETMQKEKSTDQLMSANSMLGQVSTQAKLQMMQDSTPENVANVMKNWQTTADSLKTSTALNREDKLKLNQLIDTQSNALLLHGATVSTANIKTQKKMTYFDELSGNLDNLKNLMQTGKYEEAEALGQSMYQNARNMHDMGVLTGSQFIAQQKAIGTLLDHAKALHGAISHNADLTAKDYHDLHSWPFSTNGGDATTLSQKPADENTSHMIQMHLDDQSFRGQTAAAVKYGTTDPEALMNLPSHQQLAVISTAQGAQDAQNYMKANTSWPQFVAEYNRLKAQPSDSLNSYEKGKLDHMNYIIENLNHGNYVQIVGDTVKGAQNNQQFQVNASAINDGGVYNPNNPVDAAKQEAANVKNLNDYVSGNVAIGVASHYPNEWIKPFHPQFIKPITDSFVAGADPTNAIKAMTVTTPANKAYLVNSMPNLQQQEVMRIVSLAGNNTPPGFLKDWIVANQKGQDYSPLKVDGLKDAKLRASIESNLGDVLQYMYRNGNATTMVGQQINNPGGDPILQSGQARQAGFIEASMNYIKKKAIENQDYAMSNADTYVSDLKRNIGTTHDLVTGWNYQFNNKNLDMKLTKEEADAVAQSAMTHALDRVKQNHTEAEYQSALDSNPLFMTIDQYNNIVVTDTKSKSVIYHMPFNASFVHAAVEERKRMKIKSPEQEEAELKTYMDMMTRTPY